MHVLMYTKSTQTSEAKLEFIVTVGKCIISQNRQEYAAWTNDLKISVAYNMLGFK